MTRSGGGGVSDGLHSLALIEEHSEEQETHANSSPPPKTYQSLGSIPTQHREPDAQLIPSRRLPNNTTHLVELHHQTTPSTSSDEWSLISGQNVPEHPPLSAYPNQLAPLTPSKKRTLPLNINSGNFTSPKTPVTLHTLIKVPPLTPSRSRRSAIVSVQTSSGGSAVHRSHHTPNSRTPSTSSSSSQDVNTPRTPSHKRDQFSRIFNPSKFVNAEDDFTIVLNKDEAIHWTNQTSDLRQPSPTRSHWKREKSTDSYSYPSPQQKPYPPPNVTPSKSNSQRLASPTKSGSRGTKQDQATKSWFSLSPRNGKSPGSRHIQPQEENVVLH